MPVNGPGVLLGIVGVLMFGAVHALETVPIWSRLAGGLPFAIVAAVIVTYAFHELCHSRRWLPTFSGGLRFGLLAGRRGFQQHSSSMECG